MLELATNTPTFKLRTNASCDFILVAELHRHLCLDMPLSVRVRNIDLWLQLTVDARYYVQLY